MRKVLMAGLAMAVCGAALVAQGSPSRPTAQAPAPVAAQSAPPAAPAAPRPATSHAAPASVGLAPANQTALVKRSCATCHSDRGKAGGLSLAAFDAAKADATPEVSEKIIRKLRAGMMPPAGARRPEAAMLDTLATALETRIDTLAALHPNPGRRPFQRLNRVEYTAAVRDLIDLEVDVTAYLPARHHQQGLRQRRRRADVLARADGRLPACGQPNQPPRGGRPQRHRHLGHLQDRAHGVADAPRRGRADRHARRHLGGAHVPGRRRLRLQDEPAQRAARRARGPHLDDGARPEGSGRGVHQRRARGAAPAQHADERDRRHQRPRHLHAAPSTCRRARSACRRRSSRTSRARSTTC